MLRMKALTPTNTMNINLLLVRNLIVLGRLQYIENQDQFLHLHNSYLLIEGDVLKGDNARYADADLVALSNNGLFYLFSNMKLTLARHTVEHVNYPGHATSLLDLVINIL